MHPSHTIGRPAAKFVPLALAALVLAGCATQRSDTSTTAPPTASAPAELPATPPVKLPAAAARNVVLTMTGPKHVVESKDWPEFKREWRETFADHAKEAGIAFSFIDGDARPPADAGTLLAVRVEDYRIVGITARIFFGVMTGNAFIDAKVQFIDLRDGSTVFGEQRHNTSSSAWAGVFAKMTPQQVDAIAADVFKDIKAAR